MAWFGIKIPFRSLHLASRFHFAHSIQAIRYTLKYEMNLIQYLEFGLVPKWRRTDAVTAILFLTF